MILTDKDLQMLNSMQQHQQQQHQQQHHQSIDSSMSSSLMTTMTSTTQTATVTDSDRVKDIDLKIEFDGTTVLCRVCGDKASGFHYGVHSCEGCKGFFRRSIQQKIQYRPCTKNQQCSILRINRNRCQYCRLKKCIAVGMSRDAVRFGRVPKREKAKILAAMQKVNAHSLEKALHVVLEDESNLMSAIIKAHQETCDYTKDKVVPLLEAARARPIYAQCPQMTCPLNPLPPSADSTGAGSRLMEDFSERFSPAIHGVVEFAKRIPGFGMLSQEDQVTLLKAGVFEVLLVRLACMFDSQSNSMVCLNGLSLRRDSLHSASNARFLLDSMFEFAERLNALRLSDHEIGLFCSVVVIAPDRPGIRNIDLVQKINKRLEEVLQKAIALNHPTTDHLGLFTELTKKIPDLRTLNALHSEKLLGKSFGAGLEGRMVDERNLVGGSVQPQPDSQSDNSPDRWSSSSSSSLLMGHFSPSQSSEERDRRSVSPSGSASGTHHDWSDSKDGSSQCFGSPRSMSSSSGVSSEDSHSRKGSISLSAAPPKLAYINSYVRGLASTMVIEPPSSVTSAGPADLDSTSVHHLTVHGGAKHRVDSPTDSGIESGKEHANTPTTSVCSSPRSAHGDEPKPKDTSDSELCEKQESIDDMPVLKRALQAPPLVNTNKLMDEAYRHHKKFRAAARRDTEPHSPSTTTGLLGTSQPSASTRLHVEPSTVTVITSHTSPAPTPSTLASAHSTLLKTLEQPSRYLNEQQLKRTDLIHNIIMNTEAVNAPGHTAPLLNEVIHHSGPVTSSASHLESAAGVTVLYPPAAGSYYQVPVPASCPFTGARLGSAPAPPLSAYHPVPVSRTSPSPSYPTESSTAANSLLVISSHQHHHGHPHPHSVPHHHSPGSRSVQQPPSPYSHLQRCLTGSTAPPAMPLHHPAHHHGEARGQLDLDVQPLNLSKKASAPASPVAPTNSIPVSTITSTPPTSSSSSISISPMETE